MIHECDRILSEMLNQSTGEPDFGHTEAEIDAHYRNEIFPTFFRETEAGQAFAAEYVCDDKFLARVEQERVKRFGAEGEMGTTSWPYALFTYRLEEIVGDLLRVNDASLTLANPPEPEAPAPERPRDPQTGKFISDIHAEVLADIESGSVSTTEIKRKRAESREYDSAFIKATQVQTPRKKTESVSDDLLEFANAFNSTPSSLLRFVNGSIVVGGKTYTREHYENLVTQASEAQLVRG